MAGFFGMFDYARPGEGVSKEVSKKPRIRVFFEIYSRKFWNLVKLNMLFTLLNLPAIFAAIFIISRFFIADVIGGDIKSDLIIRFALGASLICIPVVTFGPVQAGFTYILRNYSREEHAFIWSDFKEHTKKNFKQSLFVSLTACILVIIIGIDINVYLTMNKNNIIMMLANALLILGFVIFLMMHMYIYPLMVTFNFSLRQIYRNALIFSIIKFFPNLGILLLCMAFLAITFVNFFIGIILLPLLTFSTIGFITNFYVYPTIKKYIADKSGEHDESPNASSQTVEGELEKQ